MSLTSLQSQSGILTTSRVADVIAAIQTSLRDFCHWCLESAETLPGWVCQLLVPSAYRINWLDVAQIPKWNLEPTFAPELFFRLSPRPLRICCSHPKLHLYSDGAKSPSPVWSIRQSRILGRFGSSIPEKRVPRGDMAANDCYHYSHRPANVW